MIGSGGACAPYNASVSTPYGYFPSKAAGIAFAVLFALSLCLHLGQAVWKRQWWAFVFVFGALTEVIGWAGRVWSSQCSYNGNAFLIQLVTLIIAPTFFTAGHYVILGRFIGIMGRSTSPISERAYLLIFCTCDVLSLVIQAVGGGMAATAINATPARNTALGTNSMVGGIIFQLVSVTVFTGFFGIFLYRVRKETLPRPTKLLIAATGISLAMIYIRSIYRTIELLQGWIGYLITHEIYFIILDAVTMLICVGVFNIVHPAWFLPERPVEKEPTSTDEGAEMSVVNE